MANKKLHYLREEYLSRSLDRKDLNPDPFIQFNRWIDEAINSKITDANAMSVSTVDANGRPSSRMVLLKEVWQCKFIFFTNFNSRKAKDLAVNRQIAALFYWGNLERQVRIEGHVSQMPDDYALEYFNSRPLESRASAMVSPQSQVIRNREVLTKKMERLLQKPQLIKKPADWGAYAIEPDYFEFWQGRANRLHDRFCYLLEGAVWKINRLAP